MNKMLGRIINVGVEYLRKKITVVKVEQLKK
jgi:hypothetical protein